MKKHLLFGIFLLCTSVFGFSQALSPIVVKSADNQMVIVTADTSDTVVFLQDTLNFIVRGSDRDRLMTFLDANINLIDETTKLNLLDIAARVGSQDLEDVSLISTIVVQNSAITIRLVVKNKATGYYLTLTKENLQALKAALQSGIDYNSKLTNNMAALQKLITDTKSKF